MIAIDRFARRIGDAAREAETIARFAASAPFSLDDACTIPRASIVRRIRRGERGAGAKAGLASRTATIRMGLDRRIGGALADAMLGDDDGDRVSFDRFIQPRVEPEVSCPAGREIDRPLTVPEPSRYPATPASALPAGSPVMAGAAIATIATIANTAAHPLPVDARMRRVVHGFSGPEITTRRLS